MGDSKDTGLKSILLLDVSWFTTLIASLLGLSFFCGCSSQQAATVDQAAAFERIDPQGKTLDLEKLKKAKVFGGSYRISPGDVIELTIPSVIKSVVPEEALSLQRDVGSVICRVSEDGTVTLPIVGELRIAGLLLHEIDKLITETYYPNIINWRPSVFSRIIEKRTFKVFVSGAVLRPGFYKLAGDEMSLVSLITAAGIHEQATRIRIFRSPNLKKTAYSNTKNTPGEGLYMQIGRAQNSPKKNASFALEKHVSARDYLLPSDLGLSITFRPYRDSTSGNLTVTYGDEIIFNGTIDLTSDYQKRMMVSGLIKLHPEISVVSLDYHLSTLAQQLLDPFDEGQDSQNRLLNATDFLQPPPIKSITEDRLVPESGTTISDPASTSSETKDGYSEETIVLPIKGFNMTFEDTALHEGDKVVVEKSELPRFSIMGLVAKPGNYDYPADVDYSLMEAINEAGGIVINPNYAVIYRMKPDGQIVQLTVDIKKPVSEAGLVNALDVKIKPGDIIDVAPTMRTRTVGFLRSVFTISVGAYYRYPLD